jgi:hypothetical protein
MRKNRSYFICSKYCSEQKRKEQTNTLQLMFTGANVAWNIKEKTLKPLMARAHNFWSKGCGRDGERNNWFSFYAASPHIYTKVPKGCCWQRVGCADSLSKIPSADIFKLDLNDLSLSWMQKPAGINFWFCGGAFNALRNQTAPVWLYHAHTLTLLFSLAADRIALGKIEFLGLIKFGAARIISRAEKMLLG